MYTQMIFEKLNISITKISPGKELLATNVTNPNTAFLLLVYSIAVFSKDRGEGTLELLRQVAILLRSQLASRSE